MSSLDVDYVRSRISYDPETGVLRWKAREENNRIDRMWNTRFAGQVISHKNSSGHIQFGMGGKNYLAHRIAWLIVFGVEPRLIDHINGERSDNRLCNLRIATASQNVINSRKRKSSFQYRGLWRNNSRWSASICLAGRKIYLGTFLTDIEAAQAYDKAALQMFGEFARLNFPEGV